MLKDILTCRLQGQESNHRPSDWWPTSLPPETQPPCACGKHRQTLDPSCRAFLNILTSSWPHQQIDAADWSLTGLFRSQHSQIQEVTVGEETNEGRKKKKKEGHWVQKLLPNRTRIWCRLCLCDCTTDQPWRATPILCWPDLLNLENLKMRLNQQRWSNTIMRAEIS